MMWRRIHIIFHIVDGRIFLMRGLPAILCLHLPCGSFAGLSGAQLCFVVQIATATKTLPAGR
jgi:hypothetical protein